MANPSATSIARFERQLLRDGAQNRLRFEQSMRRGSVNMKWDASISSPLTAALRSAWHLCAGASTLLAQSASGPRWEISKRARLGLLAGATGLVASAAVASALVVKGYVENPASFWAERMAQRLASPIYDAEGTLVGAVDTAGKLPTTQAYDYAYIPLKGEVPPVFKDALLWLENRHLLKGGINNICGIDPRTFMRLVRAEGGGSGLAQQLTFNLKQPDWQRERGWKKMLRAAQQLGAACSLYQTLGSDEALIKAYASYVPVYQGRGVLHGIEAAAQVIWDRKPQSLSAAQQLILAAAAKAPLMVVPEKSRALTCEAMHAMASNPEQKQLTKAHRARLIECKVLNRAIHAAHGVLQGQDRDAAITELRGYQVDGISVANPFERVSNDRLVNLSTRTVSVMSDSVLRQIKQEALRSDHVPGHALTIALDAVAQKDFVDATSAALSKIQRSSAGKSILCIPLANTPQKLALRPCGNVDVAAKANVLSIKVDAGTGAIKRMYASNSLLLDQAQSIGSLAKLVVLTAAVADGYAPDSAWCPLKAFDSGRPLSRVAAPAYGFSACPAGKNALTLQAATATSDNLAFNQIALALGSQKLLNAAQALGFSVDGLENPAYSMSFGTFAATPREVLRAGQALFAVAYGVKLTGQAPRILAAQALNGHKAASGVAALIASQGQREALRQLLEAPVQATGGTLAYMKGVIDAGKTGSVQATALDSKGKNYAYGKFALSYSAALKEINLFTVASPLPSIPLAGHSIQGSLFKSAHLLLTNNATTTIPKE